LEKRVGENPYRVLYAGNGFRDGGAEKTRLLLCAGNEVEGRELKNYG